MKKYNFLFKPVFYIFCLLIATWLVIRIEKISPSDFGDHKSIFAPKENHSKKIIEDKKYLRNLFIIYKMGVVDSIELDRKLTNFLESYMSPL